MIARSGGTATDLSLSHHLRRSALPPRPGLRAADAAGVPCFLETSVEPNLHFYRRLGFEVVAELDLPDGGPRTWPMRRAVDATPDGRTERP